MDQIYMGKNKENWNNRVEVHAKSKFYDLEGFKGGRNMLNDIEKNALGNIKGKKILHLQCHFGLDTLSLARMGAEVTGADFSEKAIQLAKDLSIETGIKAEFVCSNIYDLKDKLNQEYDIVFTSYGVIGWLPDIFKWGEIAAHFLKPGGRFVLVEFHPVLWMLDEEFKRLKYSYFNTAVIETDIKGTYAEPEAELSGKEYGWNHPLSDIFTALMKNGLKISNFEEFDYSNYECFPNMTAAGENRWHVKGLEGVIPMMYLLTAER